MAAAQNRWVLAMRPKTLPAGACPVILAAAMAADAGEFHALAFAACLIGALMLQIGANFANDFSDGIRGTDANRLGPPRAVASGLITPQVMKGAVLLTFVAVFIPGFYIMYRGGPMYLVIGIASIFSALAYTGGPYPLGYHGWGEVFAFAFFGPVAVCGTYNLMAGDLPREVIVASLAPGLFSIAILTVNNLRDIDGDRAAGKRTLAARYGKGFARAEYFLCVLIATIGVPVYLAMQTKVHQWVLIACAAFLFSIPNIVATLLYTDPRPLNGVLARTGAALVVFTVLFSIGWMI